MHPLISISLVSNRPALFREMLDNLECTASDPSRVEVLVGIDEGDESMRAAVTEEQARRSVRIKYLSEKRNGFFSLWPSLNRMHSELCDAKAYFVQHFNDEARFETKGWDIALEKYIHFFPDDIFRLRVSNHRQYRYNNLIDAGPCPENCPVTTKKWIDITGWCACHSADSYQQCVALWLAEGPGSAEREIVVEDIRLRGLDAGGHLTGLDRLHHQQLAAHGWIVLFSPEMQRSANRGGKKLQAEIWLNSKPQVTATAIDGGRSIEIYDKQLGRLIAGFDYTISLYTLLRLQIYRLRLAAGILYRALRARMMAG